MDWVGKGLQQIGTSFNASVKTVQHDHAEVANFMPSRFGMAGKFLSYTTDDVII